MNLSPGALAEAADLLAGLRNAADPIPPLPPALRPSSVTEGYDLQDKVNERLTAAGRGAPVGFKIGCTTAVMQRMLDIHSPCWGTMLASGVHHGSAMLQHARFRRPGVECEIAVRLGEDMPAGGGPFSAAAVAERIEHCMAAIELVDDRYADYRTLGVATLIADDFFHAGCVLGEPRADWRAIDIAALSGRTLIDGRERGRGRGADVMGHPFAAVAWLATALAGRGRRLRRGDIVLSGSVVETQWVARGEQVLVEVDGLGSVRARFD